MTDTRELRLQISGGCVTVWTTAGTFIGTAKTADTLWKILHGSNTESALKQEHSELLAAPGCSAVTKLPPKHPALRKTYEKRKIEEAMNKLILSIENL